MTFVSSQDCWLYDISVKAGWVLILLMCKGRMGTYMKYVSRQDRWLYYLSREDGWLYYLCFKAGWVLTLQMCLGRMGAYMTCDKAG